MQVEAIVKELALDVILPGEGLTATVETGYASDLLSDVMGNAPGGCVWVTMQCHPNVVAVASLLGLTAVVLIGGIQPDEVTLEKARQAGVTLLGTTMTTFETVGRLYSLGLRGTAKNG